MYRLLIGLLCLLLGGLAPATSAREFYSAPHVNILGFSPDGRYFAYEQVGYDLRRDAIDAAVFVIDRETNKQAEGFPFGFIDPDRQGKPTPIAVGGHDIDITKLTRDEDGQDVIDLTLVLQVVREKVAPKLKALDIGVQGLRLAGTPWTQRAPVPDKATPLSFTFTDEIPNGEPDRLPIHTVTTTVMDTIQDCASATPLARELPVKFEVVAKRPGADPGEKTDHVFPLPVAQDHCPLDLKILDIILPPATILNKPKLVFVFLATSRSENHDNAQNYAVFIEVP